MNEAVPVLSVSLTDVLIAALAQAGAQLSLLVDREISFCGSRLEYVRLEDLPLCTDRGPESAVTAVYISFSGGIDGHVVLSFSPEAATYLARTLLMSDSDLDSPTMRFLADSMIGELGNVAVSAFLTAVADAAHLTILPSPPSVVHDMWGALLQTVAVEVAEQQTYALLLRTDFIIDGDPFAGNLILLPSQTSYARLEQLLAH